VNFALFSEHADGVDLCLFDAAGAEARVPVSSRTGNVWHVLVRGLASGQRYGWRVKGPYAPRLGNRYNANKLLVDPYARAIEGGLDSRAPVYGYPRDRGLDDGVFDSRDDAAAKPRCVVVDEAFPWGDDRPPGVPWAETVIYEVHVKGFTQRHPRVPEPHRGRFLGVASDAAIDHLKGLGITTVELMPVHARLDEPAVTARGLTNYWGYNTVGYFAPDERFAVAPASGGKGATREFKQMVRRLHAAGIEVVLDVVYNHTCEGDRWGPTVGFRGIDNRVYYRAKGSAPGDRGAYADYTGCGNTVDTSHPQVLALVQDSLRYWVTEMHVDGFRFDLAVTLARNESGAFDPRGVFFEALRKDPVLSRVKLMGEPWDLGSDGYRPGAFPAPWGEWNGRLRDTVRRFWRGDREVIPELGYRLTGSSDLFAHGGRSPQASVNFVAAHDGFTLRDLVSYEQKHNEANGEWNADGHGENFSQNCGVEGDTDDAAVLARRRTLARSILATLFVSQGVPMLHMGDDLWRTQRGNNNAYCQDSELTWLDWPAAETDGQARSMRDMAVSLARLRKRHPTLRRTDFLRGVPADGAPRKDITWLRADGGEMGAADWQNPARAEIAFVLAGVAAQTERAVLVLMNGERRRATFALPGADLGTAWRVVIDTREEPRPDTTLRAPASIDLDAGTLLVMEEVSPGWP
jgi:glycogen operon protein